MTGKITRLMYGQYKKIVEGLKVLEPDHPKLFNKFIRRDIYEDKFAYIGGMLCGEACFISKYLLEKEGYKVEVWRNSQGYGDYLQDHCFLWVDNSIIVDPTIKQFWQDDRVVSYDCQYNTNIQYNFPPFYIGSHEDLLVQLDQISNINKDVFGSTDMDKNWKWWRFYQNISHKFDLKRCIEDPEYLKTKPSYYQNVVEIVS